LNAVVISITATDRDSHIHLNAIDSNKLHPKSSSAESADRDSTEKSSLSKLPTTGIEMDSNDLSFLYLKKGKSDHSFVRL
jgi:hypothetical protein